MEYRVESGWLELREVGWSIGLREYGVEGGAREYGVEGGGYGVWS